MSSSATGVKKVVEAAGVELDRFSKTGLIRRVLAKLDPLKCLRAGTKQVQQITRPCSRPRRESDDSALFMISAADSPVEIPVRFKPVQGSHGA
jgi:hypothetical protein